MTSISVVAEYLVHTLYRPLVALLLLFLVSACVAPPDAPPPTRQRPAVKRAPAPRPVPAPVPAPVPRQVMQREDVPMTEGRMRPPPAMVETIRSLGMNFQGRVGIAVSRVDGQWTVDHQGDLLFPQHSVSKLWVALTFADAVDKGRLSFDDPITLTKADVTLFHQPIRALIDDDGYQTTLNDLFYRAMTESDNTANDALLWKSGGPDAVRAFISTNGLGAIRFGPGERKFQSGIAGLEWRQEYSIGNAFLRARDALPASVRGQAMIRYLNDPPDGAAPNAVVRALGKLYKGELLSPRMTRTVLGAMESAITGKQRIKGAVPSDWRYAHKTGTGQVLEGLVTGYNDVGIMTAPDGTSYAIAVLIRSTRVPTRERQALMQAVASAVVANHRR